MNRRYVISRDEPGSTEEQILDYAATEEEARRKLFNWNEEYRHEVTCWDTLEGRLLTLHAELDHFTDWD